MVSWNNISSFFAQILTYSEHLFLLNQDLVEKQFDFLEGKLHVISLHLYRAPNNIY